jgi:hypothetical protein
VHPNEINGSSQLQGTFHALPRDGDVWSINGKPLASAMRKGLHRVRTTGGDPMKTFMSIGAFALATAALPVAAQAQTAAPAAPAASAATPAQAPAGPFTMTTAQKAQYDRWASDLKAKYDAWPSGQQEYFWSLGPDEQQGWWALSDVQRGQVLAMTPDQRAQVWPSIVAQVKGRATASASSARAKAGGAS